MRLIELMSKRKFQVIFSLISGLGYYFVLYALVSISVNVGGGFLAFLFAPAVICGVAIYLIKSIRRFVEEKNKKAVFFIFIANIVIFIFGIMQFVLCFNI